MEDLLIGFDGYRNGASSDSGLESRLRIRGLVIKKYKQMLEYRPNSDDNYIVTNCCTTSVKDDMVAADLQDVDAQVPDAPLNNNHNKR